MQCLVNVKKSILRSCYSSLGFSPGNHNISVARANKNAHNWAETRSLSTTTLNENRIFLCFCAAKCVNMPVIYVSCLEAQTLKVQILFLCN